MKKLVALLAIGLMFSAAKAYSVENLNIDVTMTVQEIAIGFENDIFKTLNVTSGISTFTLTSPERSGIFNLGNVPQDYGVRVSCPAGGTGGAADWFLYTDAASTTVPKNAFRLFAVCANFNAKNQGLNVAHFDQNDLVTTATQYGNNTTFWSETAAQSTVGDQSTEGCDDVPAGGPSRSIFFRFDSGASGTSGGPHTTAVTVTARIH